MKDFEAEESKFYEQLPKERQRTLRKEYYTLVNPRAKIWRLVGIFFSLAAISASGFVFYCLVKLLFTDDFAIWTMAYKRNIHAFNFYFFNHKLKC